MFTEKKQAGDPRKLRYPSSGIAETLRDKTGYGKK
jgi:hypothetical protein